MRFAFEIPEGVRRQLETLPDQVRNDIRGGLELAASQLEDSGGQRAWGEPLRDVLPPMYVLRSGNHHLLYEVDAPGHRLRVRTLGSAPRNEVTASTLELLAPG